MIDSMRVQELQSRRERFFSSKCSEVSVDEQEPSLKPVHVQVHHSKGKRKSDKCDVADLAVGINHVKQAYDDEDVAQLLNCPGMRESRGSNKHKRQKSLLFDSRHHRQTSDLYKSEQQQRWEILYDDAKSSKVRRSLQRLLRQDSSEDECTFRPELGQKTIELAGELNIKLHQSLVQRKLVSEQTSPRGVSATERLYVTRDENKRKI